MFNSYIPLESCENKHVYRLHSRNLSIGAFSQVARHAIPGFIGIREKFGERYLATEFHWDTGEPHGTAYPIEDLGIVVPEDIDLREYTETIDLTTGRKVTFDRYFCRCGGWKFFDTGERSDSIQPFSEMNMPLFQFLDNLKLQKN
jgi:hypothetical protein